MRPRRPRACDPGVDRTSHSAAGVRLTRLEIAALTVGVAVRVLAAIGFRPSWGFDFPYHLEYIEWVAKHWSRPDLNLNAAAYHSPLYYFLVAPLVHFHAGARVVQQVSIACGCVRLGLLSLGLRRFLPGAPYARAVALLLAGVLPAAVQLDSHVSNEALGTTLAAVAVLALPAVCGERPRLADVLWFSLWWGLAVMTKVSYLLLGFVVLPFAARGAWLGLREERGWPLSWSWGSARRALAPWALGGALFAAITAPLFLVNLARYGQPIVTGYDGPLLKWQQAREAVPYFDRRTAGFYVAWDVDIWEVPYYPTSCCSSARFFPVLVASTFGDYLNYGFGIPVLPQEELFATKYNHRLVSPTTMNLSRLSVAAGSLLALVVAAATLVVGRRLWRARDPRLALLALPIAGVLGQIHFATKFSADTDGPVKGTYVQFAMLPAFALVGLVFERCARDRRFTRRALAVIVAAAVTAVAVYTITMKAGAVAFPPPPEPNPVSKTSSRS